MSRTYIVKEGIHKGEVVWVCNYWYRKKTKDYKCRVYASGGYFSEPLDNLEPIQ